MLEIRSTPSATEDKLDDPPHRRFFLWLFFLLFFFVCVKRRNWNEIEQFQQLLPTANPRRCSEQIRNSSVSLADLDFVFFFARIFFFQRKQRNAHAAPSMANLDGTFRDDGHRFEGTFFWAFFFFEIIRLAIGCWRMLIDVETAADEPRPRPRRRLVAQSGHQLGRRSRRNCESHIFFFFFYRVLLGFSHGYTGSFLVLPSSTGFHGSTLFFFVKILLWC